ncbi:antigen 5 like allergen Cul n 1-like [Armigeres subalbatus]|uniref:antigen 5 like allergen Cul n 1-like n=1 Tax=Armigeres subalbatus TaxID=124917 RepID=UPI002ED08623
MVISLVLLAVMVHLGASESDKYCQSSACPGALPNVGCGCKESTYGPLCDGKNAQKIDLDDKLKALILDEHNVRRNALACGTIKPHPPAAKMIELTWNDELEFLAECNTMKCVYGHDSCRSTSEYPFAGQNIASKLVCGRTPLAVEGMIVDSVDVWFQEYKNTTPAMTDSYPEGKVPGGPIGHFTQLVNDMVQCIGCSYITYEEQRENKKTCQRHYLVCNYSYSNFIGEKTYTKSQKPAVECYSRASKHSCLCSGK